MTLVFSNSTTSTHGRARHGSGKARPTFWHLGTRAGPQHPRPGPSPSAGNWVRFACSNPPCFALSHNMPIINTTSKLALFWRFSITASTISSIHWPLFSCHWPLFSRHSPLFLCHSPLPPKTLPLGYCLTPTAELSKSERGPISTSRPSISLCAEPGDSCTQINPFLPTRRRSHVDRSLVAGALDVSGSRRACRMAISRNARPLFSPSAIIPANRQFQAIRAILTSGLPGKQAL